MKFKVGDDFSKILFGDDISTEIVPWKFGDDFSSILRTHPIDAGNIGGLILKKRQVLGYFKANRDKYKSFLSKKIPRINEQLYSTFSGNLVAL